MKEEEYITHHEGLKLKPYKDTVGKLTIGVGRNINDNGITEEEAMLMLKNDLKIVKSDLRSIFEEFNEFPTNVKLALIDMMFNLGKPRFLGFKNMIQAVKDKNFKEAGRQAKDSHWCKQVGVRCEDDYELFFNA